MIDYRIANIKPHNIDETGEVTFTDGTNYGLMANQQTCEAYGYTYDNRSGSCRLNQQFEASIGRAFNRETNKVMGTGNKIETAVRNALIGGEANLVGGRSRNPFIVGSENKIEHSVQNSAVFGVNGTAKSQSEFVIGGGRNKHTFDCGASTETIYTDKQMSIIELSGGTCGRTPVTLTVNGDGESYINVNNNSILGYEIYITRLELGGTSGTAGDYSYRSLRGSVHIDNAYSMTFSTIIATTIGEIGGVAGSASVIDTSTTDVKSISIQVVDRASVTNGWSAIMYVHKVISTAITF